MSTNKIIERQKIFENSQKTVEIFLRKKYKKIKWKITKKNLLLKKK